MSIDWRGGSPSQKSLMSALKRSSAGMSSVLDTKVEPLFSLPHKLMTCGSYKRRKIIKNRISYTDQRLRRELFRQFVVGLLIKPEDVDINDQNIGKYYNYIKSGVDTIHVEAMDEKIIHNIIELVPNKLCKKFEISVDELLKEIAVDYIIGTKKSIVDFVVTNPFEEIKVQVKNLTN